MGSLGRTALPIPLLGRYINQVTTIVCKHMEASQREQQQAYNRPAQPRVFQPGDQVLLLLPNTACKFLTRWQGTVFERVCPVNYRLQQPGKCTDTQIYQY